MSANSERTEKPTGRRRQRAREEGQFAYSQELTSALTVAIVFVTLSYTTSSDSSFRTLMTSLLNTAVARDLSEEVLVQMIRQTGTYFLVSAVPVLAAAALASLAGSVVQGLPVFGTNTTGLKWDHLNPIRGLSRLKLKISWMEWIKIIFLVVTATIALWTTMSKYWAEVVSMPGHNLYASNQILRNAAAHLAATVIGTAAVVAVGDVFLQRYRFEKRLKQTQAEVKEDTKATEGDPTVKTKIRSIQRERTQRRMMARIKDADVIVTNPTHFAVALEYKPQKMGAPKVVAKGVDFVAQKIKEVGRTHDIPSVENVSLARALYRSVDLEQEIPIELYKAVAEVLAYVFKVRKWL